MEKIIVVVGYFPKSRVYMAKIVRGDIWAKTWKDKWTADGGTVAVGKMFYTSGKREEAYNTLNTKLIKEIKEKNN